jgi:hypothetical protein
MVKRSFLISLSLFGKSAKSPKTVPRRVRPNRRREIPAPFFGSWFRSLGTKEILHPSSAKKDISHQPVEFAGHDHVPITRFYAAAGALFHVKPGPAEHRETDEAKASLERLKQRGARVP